MGYIVALAVRVGFDILDLLEPNSSATVSSSNRFRPPDMKERPLFQENPSRRRELQRKRNSGMQMNEPHLQPAHFSYIQEPNVLLLRLLHE